MTSKPAPFGVGIGEVFSTGFRGYFSNVVPLTVASAATLGTYLAFRMPAQNLFEAGDVWTSIGIDLIGMILASIVAYPWYSYSLSAEAGEPIDLREPFRHPYRFYTQAVASFWFWAGVLLGLRYLFGLPSIVIAVFYAFYGYLVADGKDDSGLKVLGHSVRIGQGKRIGLFGIAVLMIILNMFGAIAVGFEVTSLTIALAFVGVVITSSITLVAGARVYRALSTGMEF